MGIEAYVLDVIEGKKGNCIIRGLLFTLSCAYKGFVSLRNLIYDKKLLKSIRPKLLVVSVGNIVAGGTGKTPFVQYLTSRLLEDGPVAILSRGYRREGKGMCLVNKATTPQSCGDEPYLLAEKLPSAHVIVGKKRAECAKLAYSLGAKVAVLDDGMQHRSLFRDVEIGVMHADNLFGGDFYLPRGTLRDCPSRLKEADLIVLNGIRSKEHFEEVSKILREYTDAPFVAIQEHVENGGAVASKKVGAFCAIAAPERFFATLKTLGCEVVLKETRLDHVPFSISHLERLANLAINEGAQCLVCTEKDRVKLPPSLVLSLPIVDVKILSVPTFGKEHLEEIIHKIKKVTA